MYGLYNTGMNFEQSSQEPTINDYMLSSQELRSKLLAGGNVDSEFDDISSIDRQVLNHEITPIEGQKKLQKLEASRIER